MVITAALALASSLAASPVTPASCSGPTLASLAPQLAATRHFKFTGMMLPAFVRLWTDAGGPPAGPAPDLAIVTPRADGDFLVVLGRQGCTLVVMQAARQALFEAMRAAVGPAV